MTLEFLDSCRKRIKVNLDIVYLVQRRNHANISIWSHDDYCTSLVNPIILVSIASNNTFDILVVNEDSGII